MVYTTYIIQKYTHNIRAIDVMKSFETEDEAYLFLGEKLLGHIDNYIFDWLDGDIINDEGKYDSLINLKEEKDFKEKLSKNSSLLKLFMEWFNDLQRWDTSEQPGIHFGVQET